MTKILLTTSSKRSALTGGDINISLSSEGAVSQVRQKQRVFGTPHPSVESNFLTGFTQQQEGEHTAMRGYAQCMGDESNSAVMCTFPVACK